LINPVAMTSMGARAEVSTPDAKLKIITNFNFIGFLKCPENYKITEHIFKVNNIIHMPVGPTGTPG
jgi:hypothetical protein